MTAKRIIVSIGILFICSALICSCGDRSVVGTAQYGNSGTQPHRIEGTKADPSLWNETIYCIAINETGDIIWLETYDSIDELGFSLPERQMEMWETYDVAMIDVRDFRACTDKTSVNDAMIADADMIILVAGDPVSWGCFKHCAGRANVEACVLECLGKRPKRSDF